jgi:hypothetical protein
VYSPTDRELQGEVVRLEAKLTDLRSREAVSPSTERAAEIAEIEDLLGSLRIALSEAKTKTEQESV